MSLQSKLAKVEQHGHRGPTHGTRGGPPYLWLGKKHVKPPEVWESTRSSLVAGAFSEGRNTAWGNKKGWKTEPQGARGRWDSKG